MIKTSKTGFREIKIEIVNRIKNRTWKPGDLIPREVELSEEFSCSRATINRALRELADEDYIERKRKSGTRVKNALIRHASFEIPQTKTEVESTGASYKYTLISNKKLIAPAWLKARLELNKNSKVHHIKSMHYSNGAPFQFEERWINIEAVPAVTKTDFSCISPNEWLLSKVPFTDAQISFYASACDRIIAEFLSISIDDPVFTIERTTWLSDIPVTFVKMSYPKSYRITTRY